MLVARKIAAACGEASNPDLTGGRAAGYLCLLCIASLGPVPVEVTRYEADVQAAESEAREQARVSLPNEDQRRSEDPGSPPPPRP
jgi:hypothetical protein